jgi:hypothetical protein
MARRLRHWPWIFRVPLLALFACVGPRSIQGPVRGGTVLSDGATRNDLAARLRCHQPGIQGASANGQTRAAKNAQNSLIVTAFTMLNSTKAPVRPRMNTTHVAFGSSGSSLEARAARRAFSTIWWVAMVDHAVLPIRHVVVGSMLARSRTRALFFGQPTQVASLPCRPPGTDWKRTDEPQGSGD